MRKSLIFILLIITVLALSACKKKDEINVDTVLNPGMDTIEINTVWTDEGVTLTSGEDTIIFYSDTQVDSSTLATIEVKYSLIYKDKTYSMIRYVTITDQTNPVLSILEGIDTIKVGSTWVDGGCSVVDNSLESLTCSTVDIVDSDTVGVYEITYTATDSSGNEGTIIRIVNVIE